MKKVFVWIGIVLGSLIGLVLMVALGLLMSGTFRLNKVYNFEPSNIVVPTDAASIEFGKHRAEVLCQGCHAPDLSGVENWFSAGPLGTIDSANLTSGEGGVGRKFTTDEDYVRAIRHGINTEGKPIFMPAVVSGAYLSDEDLGAIIAYVKSVPPVDHVTHGNNFTPLAKIMLAAGVLGKLPVESVSHDIHVTAPEPGATVAYGEYMVNTNDCHVCHGPALNGGTYPDPTIKAIAPNLTPGGDLASWAEEDFISAIRTGKNPNGYGLNPSLMPWKEYGNFTDEELKAIWLYLQSIPAMEQAVK